ncbi:ALBINO3-like protein 2, chloroplastic isoform X2 [Hevea brasiliensis]|uniref:ALBINO3-like protein 2, chloroplastic isoform X2 n=1 Tax=Hevea brasiliensis TaxID=3981 RepID=UPI0025CFC651|nr:ALBINO3-like protein 2, chloroplastic isoform X2 [Hevea brasiliensis]
MAIPKLLLSHLRRSRTLSSLNTLSYACVSHLLTNPSPLLSPPPILSHNPHGPCYANSVTSFHLFNNRSFSTRSNDDSDFFADSATLSTTESKLPEFGVFEVTESVVNGSSGGEESILPVQALISLLDEFHDLTGLPWWVTIASATVAMRVFLFPLLVLQLHKLKRISELFPKLPPPFPPPLSGRSFRDQISLFRQKRRAIGCPSFLWFPAYFSVQVPCFILWMTSIRRMSLEHHPGFDCGGTLWFQNLTEFPHGLLSPIFPLLIASLHYINVQLSFEKKKSFQKIDGLLGLLAKYYKKYLDLLTLPLFFIGYCIPQGSLVYWVTNSSLSVIQQLSLKHPTIRAKLGLPNMESQTATAAECEDLGILERTSSDSPSEQGKVSVENLSPKKLLALSVQLMSDGHRERAIPLLQLAVQKDPNYIEALIVTGQILLQKEMYAEAAEYLGRAISKHFHSCTVPHSIYVLMAIQQKSSMLIS